MGDTPSSAKAPPLTYRQTMIIVLGVLVPVFMGSLDNSILASALPTIGRDFGDVHNLPWLVTAYLIANTAITTPINSPAKEPPSRPRARLPVRW